MNSIDEQQQRQQQQQQQIWSLNNAILFNENVRKCGYMKKLKTNKRRYFVLSLNSLSTLSKATLSVYENEKKYREKGQPKRTILLVDCFAIARIPDQKRFVLGIYTRTDLLATVCDDEKHMNDWLKAIRSILYRTPEYQSRSLKDFHFIWQGCVNRVEGALPKSLLGTYRFCLMPTILYFIRVESTNSNTNAQTTNNGQMNRYEFPLSIIHRCGHKDKTFYLNIGRLSELGAGECWVQTDDQTIAEHMHAQISSFWVKNKKSKSNEDGKSSNTNNNSIATTPEEYVPSSSSSSSLFRPRSSSTSNAIDANQFMMHQLLHAAAAAALQYHHPPPPHYIHYLPYQQQSHTLVNNRNSMPIAAASSTSSQSPAHSRERLHSCSSSTGGGGGGGAGSVRSHTASDCSNEDLSSQGHYVTANSGHNMTTAAPISAMFPPPWNIHHLCHHHQPHSHHSSIDHSHSSQHFSSSQSSFYLNNLFAQSSSSFTGAAVNNPVTSSTSSLSTDMDNQEPHHFNMFSPINILDVQPSSSNNQDNNSEIGYAADFDLYPSHIPLASSSSSQACPKCLQMYYMHFLQQQQQQQQHHHHHQTSHQSPITSPKCHCSACLMNICHESTSSLSSSLSSSNVNFINNNNNSNNTNNSVQTTGQSHHYLPTIPAGEPSDYVPMKPINAQNSNDNTNVLNEETNVDDRISKAKTIDDDNNKDNDDDDDENCYLHMSPLAVSNAMIQSASNSVSDSIEFKLKKKDSIAEDDQNDDDKITKMRTTINASESNDDTIFNGLTRAYSTGSKPQPLAPSIGTQCSNNQPDVTIQTNMGAENMTNRQQSMTASIASQHIRTRASSTGSHGMKFRAFLSSKRRNKIVVSNQQQQKIPTCQYNENQYGCHWPITTDTASSSCCSLLEENQANKSNKAASAPILSSLIQPRVRSLTLGSKPVGLRLHNLFKNKSTNIATNSINPMLQCPASTQLQPDILGNIYSNSMLLSCGCAHHHFHNPYAHHIHGHSHAQMSLCSSTSAMTTSQTMPSQLNANHPLPVSFLPEEGDLMEIDYSANNKGKDHRSSQKIHSHHHGHGHGHHHSHHHHPHHAKQSNESDSAEKDKQMNEQAETTSISSNNNNNNDDSMDNHNTLTNKLQNSLVIGDEGDDDDDDDAYMMFKPGSNNNDDDRIHSKSLSNSTATAAPLAMNEILSDEDDQHHQQQYRRQNDDEESLYVLLSPNHQCNSPSSNHDNKIDNKDSNNHSKKKSSAKKLKSFAIRSLYSSITSSSGGSNNGDGGLKFSIKRSISSNDSNKSGNKNFRINRRNTKSESSNYDQHQKSSSKQSISKSSPSPTPANILSSTTTTATSRTTPTPPPTITT